MRRLLSPFAIIWIATAVPMLALAVNVDIGPFTAWLGGTVKSAVNGAGSTARFNLAMKVLEHPTTHDLYIVEQGNHIVRKVPFGSSTTEDWLGTLGSSPSSGTSTATGTAARLNQPYDAVMNADGSTMYLADSSNYVVRKVTVSSAANSVFAGAMASIGFTDGTGTAASS